jgi:hypothetical protein
MILYHPIEGDIYSKPIKVRANHCFIMTQLGDPVPAEIQKIRKILSRRFKKHEVQIIDAGDVVTGKDFLLKIWEIIVSVPLGIAVLSKDLPIPTMENVFFELGIMQAIGKSTVIIKTGDVPVPSDLVRTEYIEYVGGNSKSNKAFLRKLDNFLKNHFELADHFEFLAEEGESDPVVSIDYFIRAYLIKPKDRYVRKIKALLSESTMNEYAKSRVKSFLKAVE